MPGQQNQCPKEKIMVCVLVVEDDAEVCDILTRILKRAGYIVLTAANGADAIRVAQQQLPDLILMDLRLPVMGGLEATRQLKADPRSVHSPVLALTADPLAENDARAAGCDNVIIKPCPIAHLLAYVATYTDRCNSVNGAQGSV
jgi:CheY-like chemotaxis protein